MAITQWINPGTTTAFSDIATLTPDKSIIYEESAQGTGTSVPTTGQLWPRGNS